MKMFSGFWSFLRRNCLMKYSLLMNLVFSCLSTILQKFWAQEILLHCQILWTLWEYLMTRLAFMQLLIVCCIICSLQQSIAEIHCVCWHHGMLRCNNSAKVVSSWLLPAMWSSVWTQWGNYNLIHFSVCVIFNIIIVQHLLLNLYFAITLEKLRLNAMQLSHVMDLLETVSQVPNENAQQMNFNCPEFFFCII